MANVNTRFADMPEPQRTAWLRWANSHDWGGNRPARFVHDRVRGLVMETTCGFSGSNETETASHTTPRKLRDWAGY